MADPTDETGRMDRSKMTTRIKRGLSVQIDDDVTVTFFKRDEAGGIFMTIEAPREKTITRL